MVRQYVTVLDATARCVWYGNVRISKRCYVFFLVQYSTVFLDPECVLFNYCVLYSKPDYLSGYYPRSKSKMSTCEQHPFRVSGLGAEN